MGRRGAWATRKAKCGWDTEVKYEQGLTLAELIQLAREGADTKGDESYYFVYGRGELSDADLTTECFPAAYPEVTDDDDEIDPEFVSRNQLERWFRDENLQDVVLNATHQNPTVSDAVILAGLKHYLAHDCFMDIVPA